LTHIDDQKDETEDGTVTMRGMAALPGKLPNRLPGGYGEVWRVYVANSGGKAVHVVQTKARGDAKFDCRSLMDFPDPAPSVYEAMWEMKEKGANNEIQIQ